MFEALSDRTDQALAAADVMADEGDLEGAVGSLSKVLAVEDDREGRMVLLWQRAHLRRRQGRFREAVDDLSTLVALAPELPAPYLERGQLRMADDAAGAVADFSAAHDRRADPAVLLLRAAARRDLGDFEGAISDFEAVLASDVPALREEARDGRALTRLLRSMHGRGRAIESSDLEILLDRADAAMDDDPASALLTYQRAAALAPDDPRATLGVRLARLRLTKTAEAEVAMMKNREHPDLLAPLLSRADSLRRNGRAEEALEVLHEAAKGHPRSATPQFEIGLTLSCWKRDHERAIGAFDRALELDGGHVQARRHRALAFKELAQHARALADFDGVAELLPADPTVYMNRGLCHLALGDCARAEEDFSQHLRIDGPSEWTHSRRAEARLRRGDLEGALADLTAAIAAMEASRWKTAEPFAARAEVRARLGDHAGARADLERALGLERERGFERGVATLEARLSDLPV